MTATPHRRLRPLHGVLAVAGLFALLLGAQYLWEGGFSRARYERVTADAAGEAALRAKLNDRAGRDGQLAVAREVLQGPEPS